MQAVVALAAVGLLGGCAAPDNPGLGRCCIDRRARRGAPKTSTSQRWRRRTGRGSTSVPLETIRCDDGLICQVALDILNGRESVPLPLRSTENRRTDGILFREVENLAGNAELWVINSDLLNGEGGVLVGAMFTR